MTVRRMPQHKRYTAGKAWRHTLPLHPSGRLHCQGCLHRQSTRWGCNKAQAHNGVARTRMCLGRKNPKPGVAVTSPATPTASLCKEDTLVSVCACGAHTTTPLDREKQCCHWRPGCPMLQNTPKGARRSDAHKEGGARAYLHPTHAACDKRTHRHTQWIRVDMQGTLARHTSMNREVNEHLGTHKKLVCLSEQPNQAQPKTAPWARATAC